MFNAPVFPFKSENAPLLLDPEEDKGEMNELDIHQIVLEIKAKVWHTDIQTHISLYLFLFCSVSYNDPQMKCGFIWLLWLASRPNSHLIGWAFVNAWVLDESSNIWSNFKIKDKAEIWM